MAVRPVGRAKGISFFSARVAACGGRRAGDTIDLQAAEGRGTRPGRTRAPGPGVSVGARDRDAAGGTG